MNWKLAVIGAAAASALGVGCGNNDDSNDGGFVTDPPLTNNGTTNNGETNNGTTQTNNGINNPDQQCPQVEAFLDESFAIEREFFATTDITILTCADDVGEIATNGSYIARVQYSAPTTATITVGPVVREGEGRPPRPALEIRGAACETGEVLSCDTTTTYNVEFEADVPYYLVFNGLLDSGGLTLNVDAKSAICTPGEVSCEAGTLSSCNAAGTELATTTCPSGCDEDRCAGDRCEAAIEVSPEVNGAPVALTGNRSTLAADWDASNGAGCELYPDQGPTSTPGPELFIRVPGVTAGQRVTVDAEESELSYGFFVIDSCGATTCEAGFVFDANGRNRADYVATADGDVLFVVEALGEETQRDFLLNVSIVE